MNPVFGGLSTDPGVRSRPQLAWLPAVAAICLVGLAGAPALAHEGTAWEIRHLDALLAADPGSAALHLARGEAHRARGEWRSARRDFEAAHRLDPALAAVDLALGRMYLDAGRPARAEAALDRFLARDPTHSTALALRAAARAARGRPLEAAADLTAAIAAARSAADPEWYLARAASLAAAGAAHREEAIRGLDEGRASLGPLLLLDLAALDLEVGGDELAAALARVDRIAASASRQEVWLARRGDLLERMDRADEARLAYAAALAAIAVLPASRREVESVRALRTSAQAALARLEPARGESR